MNQRGNTLIIGIIVGLLVAGGLFGAYYLGSTGNSQPQLNTNLDNLPQVTPQPTTSNQALTVTGQDETANWKVYTSKDLSFKYPPSWEISGHEIKSSSPKVNMIIVASDSTLMNECMQTVGEEYKQNLVIEKFSYVSAGEMCSTSDPILKKTQEIWVIPSSNAYAPGISYKYSSSEAKEAEKIFEQIISTFKFTK